MARFLFGPINKMNGGGQMGRVANRNLITAEQIELRRRLEDVNAPANNIIQPIEPPSSPPGGGASDTGGSSVNLIPSGDGTYQLSTDPSAVIPILYGQCQVRGAVFDSELTNSNTTLTTALMLSERTGDGVNGNADYTLNEVFFNDVKLNLNANGTVANGILNDGTVTTKYNTNTEVFLYQGDVTTPIDKIQPGVDATYSSARTYMTNWANTQVQARGTLFALIRQTYDAPNGVQGLGTWTFDITNDSASNPGEVLLDFLSNDRYGAGYQPLDGNTFNIDTFVGSDATSLKSIANETRLFTSTIATDSLSNANLNILSNATRFPQLVTSGGIGTNTTIQFFEVGNYPDNSANTSLIVKGDLFSAGNLTINTAVDMNVLAGEVNRLKVFWANAATSGANCTNILSGNANTSQNTFTAFLDVARVVPDGGNIDGYEPLATPGLNANIITGSFFPGDTYDYGAGKKNAGVGANSNIVISPTPTGAGANLTASAEGVTILSEGDKLRPEGSPFIYTVDEDVVVGPDGSAGYKQFEIKVKEKIIVPDFGNIDMGNATLRTNVNTLPRNANVQAQRFDFDNDDKAVYHIGGWPFSGANVDAAVRFPGTANMTSHANVIRSNLLVGYKIMSSPNISNTSGDFADNIVLGEEKNMTINGLIKSDKTVQDIQKNILKHSGSMLNWELPEGKWKIVPNANANISGFMTFDNDNIVGEIKVTTSDITTFYNSARAQYIEKNHNSVKEDIIVHTPQFDLNTNESKHKMELSYPLCDSASEAQRKADVELKQNRLDKVVNFKSDFTGLGIEPGDIFKLTNSDYGFSAKTFRAVRIVEIMDEDILMLDITGIEWRNETYTDRIPFRKPALDDIAFEPEEYADIIDGENLKSNSVVTVGINDGAITSAKFDGALKVNGKLILGGILFSKFIGSDQSGSATGDDTLRSFGGGSGQTFTANDFETPIIESSESFLISAHAMPQGTFTSNTISGTTSIGGQAQVKGVGSNFRTATQLVANVRTASGSTTFTGNISLSDMPFAGQTQHNSLRIDVPNDCTNVLVSYRGSVSGPFDGVNGAGFDEISYICVRENT